MCFRFRRDFINELMNTFIPSFTTLLISHTTVFFSHEHFKTSVPVAVTSLLGEANINVIAFLIIQYKQ